MFCVGAQLKNSTSTHFTVRNNFYYSTSQLHVIPGSKPIVPGRIAKKKFSSAIALHKVEERIRNTNTAYNKLFWFGFQGS